MTRQPPSSPLFPYTTLFRSLFRRSSHQAGQGPLPRTRSQALALAFLGAGPLRRGLLRGLLLGRLLDRKSTRLNSSHSQISYAVFCLKKKTIRSVSGSSFDNS